MDKLIDGVPMVLVEDGRSPLAALGFAQSLKDRMHKARLQEEDILMVARQLQGLERMDQIKYAVLERSGGISIIPKQES